MQKLAKFKRDQNGSGLLLCIFVLFFMLGAAVLVVDVSILYKAKGEMRKAANAAALSGAQVILSEGEGKAVDVAKDILTQNEENDCNQEFKAESGDTNKSIIFKVTLQKNVSLYFMKIFRKDPAYISIKLVSRAKVGPLGVGSGAVPIGLPDDIDFKTDEKYPLNLTPGFGEKGNYGYLDFSNITTSNGTPVNDSYGKANPGAKTLEHYLKDGFDNDIGLGYEIKTDTGVKNGAVPDAINDRLINNNRLLLVILYNSDDINKGGKATIKVTGFAYFYLEEIKDKEISGIFIKKVSTGSVDDGAVDKGAYAIKLVE